MPKKRKIDVVIDANWYISACINKNSRRTLYHTILKNTHLQIFYSTELLQEFEGVITRKKFAKIIAPYQVVRVYAVSEGSAGYHKTYVGQRCKRRLSAWYL
jgi:uncharacterized protein